MSEKRKRSSYDASFKLRAIEAAESSTNNSAAARFGVSERTIREWIKKKAELELMPRSKKACRGSLAANSELESALFDWVIEHINNGHAVSRASIRLQALRMKKSGQHNASVTFVASAGWCTRFMERRGITLQQSTKLLNAALPNPMDLTKLDMSSCEDSEKKLHTEESNADDKTSGKRQRIEESDTEDLQSEKGVEEHAYKKAKIVETTTSDEGSSDLNSKRDIERSDVPVIPSDSNNELKSSTETDINLTESFLKVEKKDDDVPSIEVHSKENASSRKDKEPQADHKAEYSELGVKNNTDSEIDLSTEASASDSEYLDDEASNIKSEGSDKENIDTNKVKLEPSDVMLSYEEDGFLNLPDGTLESTSCRLYTLKKIKALQNQLRNEEATLVLLKKLRQSQIAHPQETVQQTQLTRHAPHQQANQLPSRPHGGPPPLVRGSQQGSKTLHNVNQNSHSRTEQLNNQSSRPQGPPPLVMLPRSSQQSAHGPHSNLSHSIPRTSDNSSQPHMQQPQLAQRQSVVIPPAPLPVQETPAQRQAAAKQALRKQLEKTLLQIPPPKPPPPEMNFIPSLACPDFVLLLGLEEVVNHMIDFQLIARGQKNPDERFVCTPFTCVQCGSDFTPVWKREKPGSKNVICEYCVTTNQKKALKQEHTNRLKSAFVKALQQEQEIERMQASTPTPHPAPSTNSQPPNQAAPKISAVSAAAAAVNAAAAAAVASFRPSAEQICQHRNFLQQAQLRAGQPLGLQAFSRSPFPYNLPYSNQQDLQRQYLLDMIPRGSMPWKQ